MASHREHVFGTVAAAFVLAAFGALAAPRGGGPAGHGPGGFGPGMHMLERAGRALQLSDQQQEQARQLLESRKPQMEDLHKQMRAARQRFAAALDAKSPDPAAVGKLAIEQHRLRQQGKALHEELGKAFQALLTPEQQQKFELLKSMREGAGPHGGPFGHGPAPEGPEGE